MIEIMEGCFVSETKIENILIYLAKENFAITVQDLMVRLTDEEISFMYEFKNSSHIISNKIIKIIFSLAGYCKEINTNVISDMMV